MAGKFQWPPRPVPEKELGPPALSGYWKPQPRSVPQASVPPAPPPSPAADLGPPQASPSVAAASTDLDRIPPRPAHPPRLHAPWRQIESTFLGLTRPAFRDRAADEAWAADLPTRFCPRCASTTGLHEATLAGCTKCSALKLPWDRAVRLGRYEGLIRTCIQEVKFSAWRRLGLDLGRELGHQLLPLMEGVDRSKLVLVPVPAPFWRRISRGIDHTGVIAKGVHKVTGGDLAPALRRRHRRPQVGLSQTDRQRNAAGSMSLHGHPRFDGCTILLIDDVRTTGATMGEAAKVLRRGLKERGQIPAAIWSCTLAVAEFGDSPGP